MRTEPKKYKNCVHLRHQRRMKYDVDLYFNKGKETFFAIVPPNERLEEKSVDELEAAIRKHHDAYTVPGAWVKKIFVSVDGGPTEGGAHLFNGLQDYTFGQQLRVGFCLFEERDGGCPPGTRMGRKWDPDPDPRWEDDRNRQYGQDIKDSLEPEDEEEKRQTTVMVWTQEREDALREIQQAMAQLQSRLEELVKKPELMSGAPLRLLGPGMQTRPVPTAGHTHADPYMEGILNRDKCELCTCDKATKKLLIANLVDKGHLAPTWLKLGRMYVDLCDTCAPK